MKTGVLYPQVTALQMDNQRLGKLSNLEKLENLRWVSFNKNDLTKIEVCKTLWFVSSRTSNFVASVIRILPLIYTAGMCFRVRNEAIGLAESCIRLLSLERVCSFVYLSVCVRNYKDTIEFSLV